MTHEAIRSLLARIDDEALNELRAASASSDAFLRRTTIEVIGQHKRRRELSANVLAALSDPSDYVRRTACAVVEQWKLAGAHDLVLPLLKEPEASTREIVLRALAAIWHEPDFQPVFALYTRDPDTRVRKEAAQTLRQNVGADNWRRLFDAFSTDKLPRHRSWACELAETFGDLDVLSALGPLMEDEDGHVRKCAVRAHQTICTRR